MTASEPLKLQFVLRRDAVPAPADKTALESRLRSLGMRLTAMGLATASGEVTVEAYRKLWGEAPASSSGFADRADGADLAVPESLSSFVQSMALVPRHINFEPGSEQ